MNVVGLICGTCTDFSYPYCTHVHLSIDVVTSSVNEKFKQIFYPLIKPASRPDQYDKQQCLGKLIALSCEKKNKTARKSL